MPSLKFVKIMVLNEYWYLDFQLDLPIFDNDLASSMRQQLRQKFNHCTYRACIRFCWNINGRQFCDHSFEFRLILLLLYQSRLLWNFGTETLLIVENEHQLLFALLSYCYLYFYLAKVLFPWISIQRCWIFFFIFLTFS